MGILNKSTLMDRVATKLAEIRNLNTVIAFFDELNIRTAERADDTPLKDYALARLQGIKKEKLIKIAKDELDMDIRDLAK